MDLSLPRGNLTSRKLYNTYLFFQGGKTGSRHFDDFFPIKKMRFAISMILQKENWSYGFDQERSIGELTHAPMGVMTCTVMSGMCVKKVTAIQ